MSRRGDRGASAVEYGLLIAGIAAATALAFGAMGDTLGTVLTCAMNNAGTVSPPPDPGQCEPKSDQGP